MSAESAERVFSKIIEAIPDAAIVTDRQGAIIGLNSHAQEYLGYSIRDLAGQKVDVLVSPAARNTHTKQRQAFYKNPRARRMGERKELTILHRDGTLMPVDISLSPLEIEGKLYVLAVIHDIRIHKEMEAALKEGEEKYRLLVENASEVFYQIQLADDPKDWKALYVSQQINDVMGVSQTDFAADLQLWLRSIHPEDLPNFTKATQEIIAIGEKKLRVYRLLNRCTGEYRFIEDQVVPRFDEHGRVVGFQGAMRDVTERELNTRAIQTLTDQLQHYLTKSPTITYALQVKDRIWVPMWKSENIYRILGYSVEESLSSTWWETAIHPDDLEAALARAPELYENDSLVREYRFVRKDGSIIWVHDEMRLIRDRDGNPIEAIGSWTDITERKKMEEALLASEENLSNIVNSAPFGALIYELGEHDRIKLINVNDTACQVLDMDRETLLSVNIEEAFPALARTEVPLRLREVIRARTKYNVDQIRYLDQNINGVFELHAVPLGVNVAAIFFRNISDLARAYEETLEGWSRAMDYRDKETEGHTQRVTQMTIAIAQAMGLTDTEIMHMRRGALLHDMGKMAIPDNILLKTSALTGEEWTIMRRHPEFAYEMLRSISFLRQALEIPYCHHEKWDGTGYPRGLKGEEIPLSARIFAVADVWDALRYDRPYRKGWSSEKVLEYIREQSGRHFDPRVVEVFLQIEKTLTGSDQQVSPSSST
ncbi:MAG: hypothetical protein DPW18_01185 [Chloroflexi bacterium]|nr:hypothetical protein [Chloroflexota bacterium]MDL1940880.1 PAS domain S-box protein [Chloroflexi bacterium CFX2]